MYRLIKNGFVLIGNWLMWLSSLCILLIALILPAWLFDIDFLRLVEIVIWPLTALTVLFFFKKIFTYLFFSMDSFNFFGAKGNLENVNAVIEREVDKRFEKEKKEREIAEERKEVEKRMSVMQHELDDSKNSKEENLKLAKEILSEWKKSAESSNEQLKSLRDENQQLRGEIFALTSRNPITIGVDSASQKIDGEKETSDPPAEETSIVNSISPSEV